MDASDNTAKPYDECVQPVLEGTFEVDGAACTTAFTLYKAHISRYPPEYQKRSLRFPPLLFVRSPKSLARRPISARPSRSAG